MIVKSKLWDIQKNTEDEEKSAQKKEEQEKEINESSLNLMEYRTQIKKLSLWIFIIPFIAINLFIYISKLSNF